MPQVPQHPSLQRQEQGLGAPTAPQAQNPYYQPSVALQERNDRLTGASDLRLAQAQQAGAEAGKAQAEANIMQELSRGLEGPTVTPQEVQAQQVAEGIANGQIDQATLGAMVQGGEIGPEVAEVAIGMAQQLRQRNEQVPQGLGGEIPLGTGY